MTEYYHLAEFENVVAYMANEALLHSVQWVEFTNLTPNKWVVDDDMFPTNMIYIYTLRAGPW